MSANYRRRLSTNSTMLIRWKNKDKEKDKCEKPPSSKQSASSSTSKKKRKFGRDGGK